MVICSSNIILNINSANIKIKYELLVHLILLKLWLFPGYLRCLEKLQFLYHFLWFQWISFYFGAMPWFPRVLKVKAAVFLWGGASSWKHITIIESHALQNVLYPVNLDLRKHWSEFSIRTLRAGRASPPLSEEELALCKPTYCTSSIH